MDKRKLHHRLVQIRRFNPKILLGLALICAFFAIIGLRNNNLEMLRLREAVFTADEQGEGVREALDDLRQYVHSHMNTDLNSGGVSIKPPIQLKYTYERLVEAEKQRVKEINDPLSNIATEKCEQQFPAGQIRSRAACVDRYLSKNAAEEREIPKELYQFDFASPRWTPDFAGTMLLLTGLFGALFVLRIVAGYVLALELKH